MGDFTRANLARDGVSYGRAPVLLNSESTKGSISMALSAQLASASALPDLLRAKHNALRLPYLRTSLGLAQNDGPSKTVVNNRCLS